MGWDAKRSYPPDASKKVTVMATDAQTCAWENAARQHGKASAGAFLAWAGDLYLALLRAYRDAVQEHDDSLDGPGGAERRRREREAARLEGEGER
jgi:hypothetical protein